VEDRCRQCTGNTSLLKEVNKVLNLTCTTRCDDRYIYNGFAVRYPDNVAAIVIRNLTVGETMLASGRVWSDYRAEQMMRSPLWIEATDGVTLSKKLRELGLIDF